jgi:DNA-binding transcriptional MerR regulator
MEKTQDAFRTIGEVAEELDLPQHVLRFWETKFNQIRPVKRAGGRRYYRPDDVQLLGAIRVLLYSEGYTIKGVQRILKEQGVRAVVTASQGSLRGATVLSLSERRARGSAPEYLSEVPLDDVEAQAAPFPQDDLFESAPAEQPNSPESMQLITCLSPDDRHRMEAVLAELDECAKTLKDAGQNSSPR